MKDSGTYFLHADGDSFFVACELSVRPELKGLPVIVGQEKGIAAAMSYEAKALGIHRGMPVFKIKKFFPEVIILPSNFELYHKISMDMYNILLSYLETVEMYSIDECFAIVKPSDLTYFNGAYNLVSEIKSEIQNKLGVTYSFGFARTKALSKIASKLEKPNGLTILLTKEEEEWALKETPIEEVWGIGWRTAPKFQMMGIKSAYDFIQLKDDEIERFFSSTHIALRHELEGDSLYGVHDNIDPRDQQSIQSTRTFRPASAEKDVIWGELSANAERACQNARSLRLLSNTVSFFVKTSEFKYRFDEFKLVEFTADPGVVLNAMEQRVEKVFKGERIRSTGVMLHNLRREEDVPRDLFGSQEKAIKKLAIETAADNVRRKFGKDALKRASSLKKVARK